MLFEQSLIRQNIPNTGDTFITTLKQAHLEWGSHRHSNSRGIVYGEGYLQIPSDDAYRLNITNDKNPSQSQEYTFSTSDGFINDGVLKASGNQNKEEFAKQFHGSGNLQLLGDWYNHINAKVEDQIQIDFITSTEILLTKI